LGAKLVKKTVCFSLYSHPLVGWWVGRAAKWRSAFWGEELAVRCERSEHGKSQLFIKYFCPILPLVFYFCHSFFQISLSLSVMLCLFRLQIALRFTAGA